MLSYLSSLSGGPLNWLANSDPITVIIYFIVAIGLGGGGGVGLYTAIKTNSRGIKGNALAQESNGITGLTNLAHSQDSFIKNLQVQIGDQQKEIDGLKSDMDLMQTRFDKQMAEATLRNHADILYQNILIRTLSDNTIPIPARP
jgi:uncharacterized coiled-coil protein SlyX